MGRQAYLAAFVQALRQFGWIEGQNPHIDIRWNSGGSALAQTYAAQLMGLQPDVIFAASTLNLEALQSGVQEDVVRLSRCSLGDAAGREDHFEIERGTGLLKRPCREPDFPDETT